MIRTFSTVTAVLAVGVGLSGCAKTTESATASSTASATAASSPAEKVPADLQSLLPALAGATTKGPDSIADNGIHLHYEVKGAPGEVMDAYKKALENKGWEVNTVVTSGNGFGGGATYSGTNGAAYGVFDGGGPSEMTYIDVCTWAARPTNPNCSRGGR